MNKNIIYIRFNQIHKLNITYTNTNKNLLQILNNLLIKDINKYNKNLIIDSNRKNNKIRIELNYNNYLFNNIPIKTYIIFSKDQIILKHINESVQIIKKQLKLKYRYIIIKDQQINVNDFIKECINKNKFYITDGDSLNSHKYVNHLYINDLINYIEYNTNIKELNNICLELNKELNII